MSSNPQFPFPPVVDTQWEQVNELPIGSDPSENEEWIEEIEYLTFDFGDTLPPHPIQSFSNFELLGLNTDKPFLQIGNQIYRGEYESLIGTELIMKATEKDHDQGNDGKTEIEYVPLAHTKSRIRWLPVKVNEGEGENESSSPEDLNGTDSKTKKRQGAGAGGRHWASHWSKFTPRSNRSKQKSAVVEPSTEQQSNGESRLVPPP